MSRWSRRFWFDLLERVGSTFLGALLGAITLTSTTPVDWSDGKAIWAVLGVPTVIALIKGLLANMADAESGASLLPSPPGPEVDPDAHDDGPARWNERGESYVGLAVVVVLIVVVLAILVPRL